MELHQTEYPIEAKTDLSKSIKWKEGNETSYNNDVVIQMEGHFNIAPRDRALDIESHDELMSCRDSLRLILSTNTL